MKKLYLVFCFCLVCGGVKALPQDWPCDEITLHKVGINEDGKSIFRGVNEGYQIEISSFDETVEHPFLYNCGNSGCWGIFKNLATNVEEMMRFDCLLQKEQKTLSCVRISGDEFLFDKASDNEYRAVLCGEYYLFFNLNECEESKCLVRDSRGEESGSSVRKMNCLREGNEHFRCEDAKRFEEEI